MMSINNFVHNYRSKNEATSNMKIQQILLPLCWRDVRIYLRDRPFTTDVRIVNLHPTEGTHWVAYSREKYSDSYGCSLPNKLCRFLLKRNG